MKKEKEKPLEKKKTKRLMPMWNEVEVNYGELKLYRILAEYGAEFIKAHSFKVLDEHLIFYNSGRIIADFKNWNYCMESPLYDPISPIQE